MRGAGTSIAGNAVGPGIVVDTSRHLNRVLALDPEARTARVQPGVVHAALQQQALPHGLRFGPDPSTHTRCTIGGMIGNNACGSRALGYGRTVDNVEALTVLLADGTVVSTARPAGAVTTGARPRLVDEHLGTVRTEFGRFGRQVSGYSFEHLLPESGRRFDRFLVGTEGTLGGGARGDRAAGRGRARPRAGRARLRRHGRGRRRRTRPARARPASPARASTSASSAMVPGATPSSRPAAAGCSPRSPARPPAEAESRRRGRRRAPPACAHRVVTDAAEQLALWRIREDGAGLAARSLTRPAQAGWEDAAVPPAKLGAYLRDFDALLDEHRPRRRALRPLRRRLRARADRLRARRRRRRRGRFRSFVEDAADLVASYGGSMSGEHGDGRARSELLPRMYSPEAIALMEQAKRVLDPDNLLNPGVLVDPAPFDADLRLAAPQRPVADDAAAHPRRRLVRGRRAPLHRASASASPTTPAAGGVMCPSYLATRDEKDSTRGRARVLQDVVTGAARLRRPGRRRRARPVPVLQGLRPRLPDRHRHGDLQVRGPAPEVPPASCARAPTTRWASCRAGRG